MSLCLFFTGFSFWIPSGYKAQVACVALGLYLFGIVYSLGDGPVPFTFSAEAYPLYIRPLGMSLATATTWFFNFVLSVTWPSLLKAFTPQGVFGVRTRDHAAYGLRQLPYFFKRYIFRQDVEPEQLYEKDHVEHHPSSFSQEKEEDQTARV